MLLVRPTHPLPGMPVVAVYTVVGEDACHFFITPARFEGPVFRLPLRNVYIPWQRLEPQEILQLIRESM
jgi:hypothetical protein